MAYQITRILKTGLAISGNVEMLEVESKRLGGEITGKYQDFVSAETVNSCHSGG